MPFFGPHPGSIWPILLSGSSTIALFVALKFESGLVNGMCDAVHFIIGRQLTLKRYDWKLLTRGPSAATDVPYALVVGRKFCFEIYKRR